MVPRSNVRRRYTGSWAGLKMAPPNSPTATATSAAISNDAQRGSHDLQPRNVRFLFQGTWDTVDIANSPSRGSWDRMPASPPKDGRWVFQALVGIASRVGRI